MHERCNGPLCCSGSRTDGAAGPSVRAASQGTAVKLATLRDQSMPQCVVTNCSQPIKDAAWQGGIQGLHALASMLCLNCDAELSDCSRHNCIYSMRTRGKSAATAAPSQPDAQLQLAGKKRARVPVHQEPSSESEPEDSEDEALPMAKRAKAARQGSSAKNRSGTVCHGLSLGLILPEAWLGLGLRSVWAGSLIFVGCVLQEGPGPEQPRRAHCRPDLHAARAAR